MAISKIILNGVTQIDVTGVTTIESDVANNKVFIKADGTSSTGSYVAPTLITKSITANGTYDPADDNADGYSEVTVNVSGGSSDYPWAGPNATLFHTFSDVEYALEDTDYATWTPTTTSTQILAAQTIDSQIQLPDLATYDYYVVQHFLFVPAFVTGATLKATLKRQSTTQINCYYGTTTTDALTVGSSGYFTGSNRIIAFYNASGNNEYASGNGVSGYGIFPYTTASHSTSTSYGSAGTRINFTAKTPRIDAKCQAGIFSTTAATELDQAESKFTIKTYIVQAVRGQSLASMGVTYNMTAVST